MKKLIKDLLKILFGRETKEEKYFRIIEEEAGL